MIAKKFNFSEAMSNISKKLDHAAGVIGSNIKKVIPIPTPDKSTGYLGVGLLCIILGLTYKGKQKSSLCVNCGAEFEQKHNRRPADYCEKCKIEVEKDKFSHSSKRINLRKRGIYIDSPLRNLDLTKWKPKKIPPIDADLHDEWFDRLIDD